MAVKIRLKRLGKKKQPVYRIVVMDSKTKRDGKTIDELGQYIPTTSPKVITLNEEKAKDWLSKGAIPSDTVARILGEKGIIEKPVKTAQKATKKAE